MRFVLCYNGNMKQFILSAFSDEAGTDLETQIAALHRNHIDGMEVRGVDGVNIADFTPERAAELHNILSQNGIRVFSLGSPIGKIALTDDFTAHTEKFKRLMQTAHQLDAKKIRIFSFYVDDAEQRSAVRNTVIERLGILLELAHAEEITLCHENERGVYGESAADCRTLADALPDLKLVFDPANFVLAGQEIRPAWELLADRVDYLHIKDALPDGRTVPAGKGDGEIPYLLGEFTARGGVHLTLEPHLHVFSGLASLESSNSTLDVNAGYPSQSAAFDAASNALHNLIRSIS